MRTSITPLNNDVVTAVATYISDEITSDRLAAGIISLVLGGIAQVPAATAPPSSTHSGDAMYGSVALALSATAQKSHFPTTLV